MVKTKYGSYQLSCPPNFVQQDFHDVSAEPIIRKNHTLEINMCQISQEGNALSVTSGGYFNLN